MKQGIYLDNSTTTRPSNEAVSSMMPFFTEMWGTPVAPHQFGQQLVPSLEHSYKAIYALFGAKESDNFVFTSSGAEAVNHTFLSSYFDITRHTGKNHFILSKIDEAPALMSMSRLEQLDCVGKMVSPNDKGQITVDAIADAMTPRTALVSLEWANGMTGVIHPVQEIAQLCRERGARIHLDATHVLGRVYFDLQELGADFITFNGDNLHAPKGTGGLYIKDKVVCSPFITGGMEQGGQRAGSINIPALAGLGCASKQMLEARDFVCTEVARLRDKLEKGVSAGFPRAHPLFKESERLPHVSAMAFPGIANEALLFALNRKGIFASIGGGSYQQIGLILAASGIDEKLAHTAIHFSLSRETTEEEIDKAIEIIVDTAKRMAKVSSLWEKL
jgi:cysteine desulfurase